ncbi:MAG: PAS domain S-box protein [Hyphomicrobiales bacterium]|nr:MAG: PAS domain S-box protein [Hyphomicrobiales bacterium]
MNLVYSHEAATLDAFSRSFAVIEFSTDGTILKANENFCSALGYSAGELIGKHHRMFVGSDVAKTQEYAGFWRDLAAGRPNAGEFHRLGKDGKIVWIQASYCPVRKRNGKVVSVVKLAADITASKLKAAENESILDAVSRSQGMISFSPTGEILDANDNFLSTMGYAREEIVGKQHRMFVSESERDTPAYAAFWDRLRRGDFVASEFRRIGKGGKEVLIQAAYNPVLNCDGRVVMIKKMVFDLSERMASINSLGQGLTKLAAGDLTFRIDAPLVQTMESLRRDYNDAVANLQSLLLQIADGGAAMHRNTQEISQGADELARRTEQQASNLEETAAALEEITVAGKKAAAGASHAREVVSAAKADATTTGEVVRKTVVAMGGIEKSSQQISQIIAVIDEIAFQTNLLALNAGVEAARAGEAGRGFAVVASEVRALAQRSAEAAKEIKGLISTSSNQVADGAALVAETGKALERILVQVGDINDIVVDIASGAQEQATGLHQVNSAITQMDQTTQQNAAMVEETTAASHALAKEASSLSALIGRFNIRSKDQLSSEAPIRLHMMPKAKPVVAAKTTRGVLPAAAREELSAGDADWAEF